MRRRISRGRAVIPERNIAAIVFGASRGRGTRRRWYQQQRLASWAATALGDYSLLVGLME